MSEFMDFATLQRPSSPNSYLVAPEGVCQNSETDAVSPVFPMAPEALFTKLLGLIDAEKQWTLGDCDRPAQKLNFVAVSKLMRFKDDVDVEVFPVEPDGARVAIYSRSRVGYSDLGANRKRVKSLLDDLESS